MLLVYAGQFFCQSRLFTLILALVSLSDSVVKTIEHIAELEEKLGR